VRPPKADSERNQNQQLDSDGEAYYKKPGKASKGDHAQSVVKAEIVVEVTDAEQQRDKVLTR